MFRLLPLFFLVIGLLFQAPALAAVTPTLAEALSSARAGVGNVITDGNGQAVYDGEGRPLSVTAIETTAVNQTVSSLAAVMRVPVADLLAFAQRLGMTLPMVMPGTMTSVSRSDGGVEQIFVVKSNGSQYAFMADKTGSNTFGVRMANVDAMGMGNLMTAHGLNGNFTNPPWYLSEEAKRDYWIAWGQEQVLNPPVVQPPASVAHHMKGVSSLSPAGKRASIRLSNDRVLDQGQRPIISETTALLGVRGR